MPTGRGSTPCEDVLLVQAPASTTGNGGAATLPLEDMLRALREAPEEARSLGIELTDDYLELIAQVEALPDNQSGSDKSHVWPAQRAFVDSFKNVRLLPPKV